MFYTGRIKIGTTAEGASQSCDYYFIDTEREFGPPLLLTTTTDGDKFIGCNVAAAELDFMERRGLRQEIAARLREMLGPDRLDPNFPLKRMLMNLGNRLVREHGFMPAPSASKPLDNNTAILAKLSEWMNGSVAVQDVLAQMGVSWPLTDQQRQSAV